MGNRHSQHGYSFEDQFNILGNGPNNSGIYKLQSRENGELLTGRQLSCNDQNEAYELECIVHQKLTNPSPFVTKLLKSQSRIQDSYCGTTNKFYLLYRQVSKTLADQINERQSRRQSFAVQQIETVITRVAKAIKYLYDIYHHHTAVSSRSITWPTHPKEPIQLIDQWELNSNNSQSKHRLYRPKDEQDINEKTLQKSNDLYSLGLVAKQMASLSSGNSILYNQPGYNQMQEKIKTLTSYAPQDRLLIYNMINPTSVEGFRNEVRQVPISETRNSNFNANNNRTATNMEISQAQINTVQYHHPPPVALNVAPPPQIVNMNKLQANYSTEKKINTHEATTNMNMSKLNQNFFAAQPTQPLNQSTALYQVFSSYSNQSKANQNALNTRVNNLSASKANISINSQPAIRNSSVGKVFMSTGPTTMSNPPLPANTKKDLNISFSGQSISKSFPAQVQYENRQSTQVNQSIQMSQVAPRANIQFNNQAPSASSFPSNSVASKNNYSLSLSNSFQPSVPAKNNTGTSFALNNFNSNNIIAPPINVSSSFAPLTSNLQTGLNYSFGQSSDQTFSFKGLSNSDQNLFTSPDFLTKIKQGPNNGSFKQQVPVPNQTIKSVDYKSYQFKNQDVNDISNFLKTRNGANFEKDNISQEIPSKTNDKITLNYDFGKGQYNQIINSNLDSGNNGYSFSNKTPIQSLKPSLPLVNSIEGSTSQNIDSFTPIPSTKFNYQQYKREIEQNQSQIPTISSVHGPISTDKYNSEVFQNVTNIPITKSIESQGPVHDIFDKIASNHNAYSQSPNIVVHQQSKDNDYVKTTPGKSKSNQPFSTIPEVSERSGSARSDDERDYVIEQYENGSRYEGFKSNGMRNGKGKFFYQQGSFYDGEWKNNNMHGYGKLFYSNNKLAYEGEWFIDQFHGRGKVYNDQPAPIFGYFDYTNFDNLDQKWKYYQGDLVCDSKQGEGKLVLSNDEYYEGQFRNDKVDGKGKFVARNGEVIKGIWEDSRLIMKI